MVIPFEGIQHDVLDAGYVRLIDLMGSDKSIVRAARVSYDGDGKVRTEDEDKKLINYLWKNKHTSPFEACTITIEVKAPIFVFRQWHRHRTWSYNEISARYAELPNEYYIPSESLIGEQSKDNKQARTLAGQHEHGKSIDNYDAHCTQAFELYKELLDAKWPRELARMCLPLSTYSRMYATANLLNVLKFLALRDHEHAQYEIRVYAEAIKKILLEFYPWTMEAVENNK